MESDVDNLKSKKSEIQRRKLLKFREGVRERTRKGLDNIIVSFLVRQISWRKDV